MSTTKNAQNQAAQRATGVGIILNLILGVGKATAGLLGQSQALLADAAESLTDVLSSTASLLGLKYAARPADGNHPYGHGRAEPLMAMVSILLMCAAAIGILISSVHKLIMQSYTTPAAFTLYLLAGVIVLKELLYRRMRRLGKQQGSTLMVTEAWHHRADAITSILAFVGICLARYAGKSFESSDVWAAILASGLILFQATRLGAPAIREIMDEHIYDDLATKIKEESYHIVGVKDTEKCFVRKVGTFYYVELHLLLPPEFTVLQGHDIAHEVKDYIKLQNPAVADVLTHIEPFCNHSDH